VASLLAGMPVVGNAAVGERCVKACTPHILLTLPIHCPPAQEAQAQRRRQRGAGHHLC
jgi:hypothetical protein